MGCQVDLQDVFPTCFSQHLQDQLTTPSGTEAEGCEASLQPLPLPLQSQCLQRKPDNNEYLLHPLLTKNTGTVVEIGSLSLIPFLVSCVLVRFFPILYCILCCLLSSPLCLELSISLLFCPQNKSSFIYPSCKNPLCEETERRKKMKIQEEERAKNLRIA